MQAKFPGTCRDCGTKFPAGTDIDWQKGKGASCCNGTPQAPPQADRAFIVDGAMKMEWVEEKTYQEGVAFQGDSVIYEERVYSGYNWMCFECKLVWDKQHQAKNCGKRDHVTAYEDTYGVREVENGIPKGNNMYSITRTAIRREESKDAPPVAPAPQEEPAPKRGPAMTYMPDAIAETIASLKEVLRKDKEELDSWMNETAPQADPQDMTSEEMWESMASVNQPTITTTWN